MSLSLRPQRVFAKYSEVTPQLLRERDIRLLLCDLDYTLAPKYVPDPDADLRLWISRLREAGIQMMVVSNNRSRGRVEHFCDALGIDYVKRAKKPAVSGFFEAMRRAGTEPAHTAMLGDKLLTDMLGANRCGILALMVEPLGGPHGAWNHVLHLLQRPFKALAHEKGTEEKK